MQMKLSNTEPKEYLKINIQINLQSLKIIPLTLSGGCWELTIHIVDLKASKVFGGPRLRSRKQSWVIDREVAVVVLQDGQSCSLNAREEKRDILLTILEHIYSIIC